MRKFEVPEDLLLPENEGELLFAQRVAELSYLYTKESYRVSTTTVPFLAYECLSVIDDHRQFGLHISGVERVLDELKRKSHQNIIVQKIIDVPLNFYFDHDLSNISKIEDSIRVFSKQLTPIRYLKEASSITLSAGNAEKTKIDFLASEITCALINLGVSQDYIYQESCRIFFNEAKPEAGRRIEKFLESVRAFESGIPTFSALIPIQAGIVELNTDVLKLFRSEIVEQIPDDFVAPPEFVTESEGKHLLFLTQVGSPDYQSAAKLLKRNVVRIHDLLGLFYHKGSNEIGPCILIAKTGEPGTSVLVRSDQNLMQLISDNPRTLAARKLETMIKTLRLPRGEDSEKFFRVVDFHGMSLSSPIPENQLINLWTSLETIAPSLKGKSIVGSVCEGLLPIIGLQYISRTFLNAARDIKRWDKKKFREAMKGIERGEGIIEKTFLLICDPAYDALCTSLLAEMHDFPLLKFRIFDLNRKYKSGKSAEIQIKCHLEKAEQQLHRIYRARNSIVHSAQKDQLTENLIISAHEYFDQVFSLTVELCSKPFTFDNYRDAFSFSKMAFNSYIKSLGEIGADPPSDASKFVWRAS
ncbi:hypothetical protein JNB71_01660 [Rhizobium herbae]|uniref:Apea-like HEPN domain-containing protein n=1 Tax=Rhizobium herbae TaxID=508661 RepID=A0ABS7H5F8_9HYPH|nr:hypothetical protein [Rhizobium herbae]MBW9062011.1 hypothetical protein [Rhizobium herbae]